MTEKKAVAKKVAGNSAKNATPKATLNARTKTPPKQATPPPRDPQALALDGQQGDTFPQTKAKAATKASINAVMVINAYQSNIMGKDVDITELVTSMRAKFKAVNDGDLSNLENMLVGQATALQTMFTSLAQRAASQEYLKQYQTYTVLALKAQAQSRATISALADLKYPKQAATFVNQANISSGHQQVNNGSSSGQTDISTQTSAHQKPGFSEQYTQVQASAGDFQTAPNKLLEAQDAKRLDIGAQAAAGRANQGLETVGAVHRA